MIQDSQDSWRSIHAVAILTENDVDHSWVGHKINGSDHRISWSCWTQGPAMGSINRKCFMKDVDFEATYGSVKK